MLSCKILFQESVKSSYVSSTIRCDGKKRKQVMKKKKLNYFVISYSMYMFIIFNEIAKLTFC